MKICILNKTKSFFFYFSSDINFIHLSSAVRKMYTFVQYFQRNKGIMLVRKTVTNFGVKSIKLSHLLLLCGIEFMSNTRCKTPHSNSKPLHKWQLLFLSLAKKYKLNMKPN